jgi:histidinol dehydrogenase
MNLIAYPSNDFDRLLSVDREVTPDIRRTVRDVIAEVRRDHDDALRRLTRRFQPELRNPPALRVPESELKKATVPAALKRALAEAQKNIRAFALASLEKPWSIRNRHGARVGERFDPIARAGVYIPGGTAPLISTVLMTVELAKAAGVREIAVCTPPPAAPALLYALKLCGVKEIYQVGGAQAIAAMAYGTETIKPVDKIFGPGNAYVTEAKRQVFGRVGIDLLAGPSEVMIVADRTANPEWVAADLLAQAEHGTGSRVFVASDDRELLARIDQEVGSQLERLWSKDDRRQQQRHIKTLEVLKHTFHKIWVKKLALAAEAANQIAPEHLQVIARDAKKIAGKVTTAGAIFLGPATPTVLGDYVAGPSHTLPTGGAARSFSGLRPQDFRRRTSIVEYDARSLKKALKTLETLANAEGLHAHARSARIRLKR